MTFAERKLRGHEPNSWVANGLPTSGEPAPQSLRSTVSKQFVLRSLY